MNILKKILLFIVITGLSGQAMAVCPNILHVSGPATLNVDPTIPVNTVLATVTLSWPVTTIDGTCVEGTGTYLYTFTGNGIPNGNLYPTSIQGVSYRGKLPGWDWAGMGGYWPVSQLWNFSTSNLMNTGNVIIEFVKTGPMNLGGTFGNTTLMYGTIKGSPWTNIFMDNTINVLPTAPACTVTQSVINVTLDSATQVQLKNSGNTANEKQFSIPINCKANTNLSLSFSGDMASSSQGVFKNTNAAMADKVGVQLLDANNNPINADSGQFTNLGFVNGSYNYPMKARYYALASNVDAGDVGAVAYATITYN